MISKGAIAGTVALGAFGWLFFSAAEQTGQRYERLRKDFPDPFCQDAAVLVRSHFMLEEQYLAYYCSVETLLKQDKILGGVEAMDLTDKMLRRYRAMTEPVCWLSALEYLKDELPLYEYYELGCDVTRIPNKDVFHNALR